MSINWDKVEFKNEKRFLSNMYPCKIVFDMDDDLKSQFPNVMFDGETYGSSEHIYMAMKSKNPLWHKIIRETEEPRETKKLNIKHLHKNLLFETETDFLLRKDWDEIKVEVMNAIVYLKFSQNKDLREKLLATTGYIEERNDWNDIFWGTDNGIGENNLGKILMKVRNEML